MVPEAVASFCWSESIFNVGAQQSADGGDREDVGRLGVEVRRGAGRGGVIDDAADNSSGERGG